nr:MAG TPA: hypothetical protein [Caudoviricetes sp.]
MARFHRGRVGDRFFRKIGANAQRPRYRAFFASRFFGVFWLLVVIFDEIREDLRGRFGLFRP